MQTSILRMVFRTGLTCAFVLSARIALLASPASVTFSQVAKSIEAYDFVEVTLNVASPDAKDPFTDVTVQAEFGNTGESKRLNVDGFCDSPDGTVFRVRFMPWAPGDYTYSVTYRQGSFEKTQQGTFHATDGHRRGPIRADPKYPWHFIWEGTGSTTSSTGRRPSG